MLVALLYAALGAADGLPATIPNERAAEDIISSATAGWGRLDRMVLGGGEVRLEGAARGRAATYRIDESSRLAMLDVNSAGCRPFPDREGLILRVVRALDPGASPRRIRFVTSLLLYDWTPPGGNAAIQIGEYVVAGHRIGGTGCAHDNLSIQRAPAGSHYRQPPR